MAESKTAGIERRHKRACASHTGRPCNCEPSWRASVYSPRDRKSIKRTFPTHAAARSWRAQASREVALGKRRATTRRTVKEAGEAWLAAAERGEIRNRSRDPYKPSTLRSYRESLALYVYPVIAGARLSELTTAELQRLVGRWEAENRSPSTIRNAINPLRAIYGRAIKLDGLAVNPTTGLDLPAVRGKRDRIVSAEEAAERIAALPPAERTAWATAFYGGLRLGELQALKWESVDLAAGTIEVRDSWDAKAGRIEPKSRHGKRRIPIPGLLRGPLTERAAENGRAGFVFGRSPERPFAPATLYNRAYKAWDPAGLDRLTLHEARHTYASLMIAAGVNAKALSTYMGHGSIAITFDRYGHLMPGNEAEAAELLDAYLERSNTAARLAQLDA